jgi:hypothetical protein
MIGKIMNRVPYESESWSLMSEMTFEQISNYSNLFPKWKLWKYVENNPTYINKIIKPVNMYAHHFSSPPEIIKKSKNKLIMRYYSYADILIQIADPLLGNQGIFKSKPINNLFYATDKCWLRQFYPSQNEYDILDKNAISNRIFKLYIPWFLDLDIKYSIKSNIEYPSIKIIEKEDFFTKTTNNVIIKEANFVDFYFTNFKNHMQDNICGLIKKGTYLFDIEIESDKKTIKKIIKEYEKTIIG